MAENNSQLTALFEALVIAWLKVGTITEVAARPVLNWSAVDGVKQRAVERRLQRREEAFPESIGIDETAFQRCYDYVTVINSGDRVLHVADDRKQTTLDSWTSLGDQDPCHVPVGLQVKNLGAQGLAALVQLGDKVKAGTDQAGRAHGQALS